MNREKVLARLLRPMAEAFDVVLVDCPPALDLLNTNGLAAAHEVIIPVESSTLAAQALPEFLNTIEDVRREVNSDLMLGGVFVTKHQPNTSHSQQILALLNEQFPGKVYQALIPQSVIAKDSVAASLPLVSYNPRSSIAEAYRHLAEEITHHA
jgi:chromosome partitioning protein